MKKLFLLFLSTCCALPLLAQQSSSDAINQFTLSAELDKLAQEDIADIIISSEHVSSVSGIHHYYFNQAFNGIPIKMAVGDAHFVDNRLISTHATFEENIVNRINTTEESIDALDAIQIVASSWGFSSEELQHQKSFDNSNKKEFYKLPQLSSDEISVQLQLLPMAESKEIRLAWQVNTYRAPEDYYFEVMVDATTGAILSEVNQTVFCHFGNAKGHVHGAQCAHQSNNHEVSNVSSNNQSLVGGYNVYPDPLISPADGNRILVSDPDDAVASPFGWHDTNQVAGPEFTITRGNNTHAYEDGNNAGFSPNGGNSLTFNFSIDTTYSSGMESESAVITNLFYWTNRIHDIIYHYGLDEAAGNFQANNYGNGGIGGDYVFAEAQDGSGTCNANFATPSDGGNGRMQMYVCNSRDGDLDNPVIVHEYAHGISNRLTGGGGNTGCLSNGEQMGEGWSDYYGLMFTMKDGDAGTDARGIGQWLTGEPLSGDGIRTYPYSTDMNINSHTYADISSESFPHGLGSVWCAMLWEMTWGLIDQYGFDPDLINGTGGNNIALALVTEGMKLQPCSPGFVDGRDAILLADQNLYGGANQCIIWEAFAKRGLGANADQGSNTSRSDGTEDFTIPFATLFTKTADVSSASIGDTLTFTLKIKNPTLCNTPVSNIVLSDTLQTPLLFVPGSASNGGSFANNVVSYPTITSLGVGDSLTRTFKAIIDPAYQFGIDFFDNIESGGGNWLTSSTSSNQWAIQSNTTYSGSASWFAQDYNTTQDQFLDLDMDIMPTATSTLSFWHSYNTESNWDGGVVQYSTDNGSNWNDLGDYFIQNGYNGRIDNNSNTPAFSGNSSGFIESIIDLGALQGSTIRIRFWMSCDVTIGGEGWYIDDVRIQSNFARNEARYTADGNTTGSASITPVIITMPTVCDSLFEINGIIPTDVYRAAHILRSAGTIQSPSNVEFKSAGYIDLLPNFEVELGAEFLATFESCQQAMQAILEQKAIYNTRLKRE